MSTKLTAGLVGGLMTVIQVGSAQGISTVGGGDTTFGNVMIGYAEVVTVADANVSDNSFNRSADGSWLDFGAAAQQGSAATSYQDSLSLMPVNNEFADILSSSAADFTTKGSGNSPMQDKAGMSRPTGGVPVPQLSAPEPGTTGLLLLGGAALVGGALRRRKQAA